MFSGQRKFSFLSFNFWWEGHVVQTLDTISANVEEQVETTVQLPPGPV